jgi:hypothetical protein
MASTIVEDVVGAGLGTLTLELFALDSDTLASTGTATEETNRDGLYRWTVTEALDGVYHVNILEARGIRVRGGYVDMADDANVHRVEESYATLKNYVSDVPTAIADYGMQATYGNLLERIGHDKFGIRSGYSVDQSRDIEDCIRDGLHDVYSAHSWSFLRPVKTLTTTAPYSTGTITVASGVVTLIGGTFPSWAAVGVLMLDNEYYDVNTRDGDTQITLEDTSVTEATASTYEIGRPEYDLDSSVEAVDAIEFAYEAGQADAYPPLEQRHDSTILRKRQDDPYHDRPLFFSVRTVDFDPTVGSRRRIALYPTPDAAYVLKAKMRLRPVGIDETNEYPIGGESLTQVIIEACLAAAERNLDEQEGVHTKRFQELLPQAIAADLEMTSPTSLGPDAPRDENSSFESRKVMMGTVTLNGVEM